MSRMISSFLSVYLIYLQAAFSLHRRTYQRSSVPRERVNMKKEERKKERGREDTRHVTPNHQSNPKRLMTAKRDGMQKETNEEKLRRRYLDSDSFLATLLDWGRAYGHIHPHSTRGVLVRATVDDDDDEPRCCCSARVPIFFLAFSVASDRTRRQREKNISFFCFLLFLAFPSFPSAFWRSSSWSEYTSALVLSCAAGERSYCLRLLSS